MKYEQPLYLEDAVRKAVVVLLEHGSSGVPLAVWILMTSLGESEVPTEWTEI